MLSILIPMGTDAWPTPGDSGLIGAIGLPDSGKGEASATFSALLALLDGAAFPDGDEPVEESTAQTEVSGFGGMPDQKVDGKHAGISSAEIVGNGEAQSENGQQSVMWGAAPVFYGASLAPIVLEGDGGGRAAWASGGEAHSLLASGPLWAAGFEFDSKAIRVSRADAAGLGPADRAFEVWLSDPGMAGRDAGAGSSTTEPGSDTIQRVGSGIWEPQPSGASGASQVAMGTDGKPVEFAAASGDWRGVEAWPENGEMPASHAGFESLAVLAGPASQGTSEEGESGFSEGHGEDRREGQGDGATELLPVQGASAEPGLARGTEQGVGADTRETQQTTPGHLQGDRAGGASRRAAEVAELRQDLAGRLPVSSLVLDWEPANAAPVRLRLQQGHGPVSVSVHTPEVDARDVLRSGLDELTSQLRRAGYEGAWAAPAPEMREPARAQVLNPTQGMFPALALSGGWETQAGAGAGFGQREQATDRERMARGRIRSGRNGFASDAGRQAEGTRKGGAI